jgi:hypothetical protein
MVFQFLLFITARHIGLGSYHCSQDRIIYDSTSSSSSTLGRIRIPTKQTESSIRTITTSVSTNAITINCDVYHHSTNTTTTTTTATKTYKNDDDDTEGSL